MHTDSSTSKTDGICAFASFYMSLCCRSELFLNSGELNPCCPDCQRPTEWIIVLRGSSGIVAHSDASSGIEAHQQVHASKGGPLRCVRGVEFLASRGRSGLECFADGYGHRASRSATDPFGGKASLRRTPFRSGGAGSSL